MKTLPVRMGKWNTMLMMGVLGILIDVLVTGGISLTSYGKVELDLICLGGTILRVGGVLVAYERILRYPKENYWVWGAMSLLGLTPVLWAQRCLVD
jgi:hypothetical protein